MSFEHVLEQEEAKRLLSAALQEGPAHAYLFHGPRGVGKRTTAVAFAAELLGDAGRVERRAHPDLYVLEPVGEQIRIDAIRTLRRDLHMRPFEASRRVYLVFGADLMNEDAADALLKDLEEPPAYAAIVLVADELGPLPETIRSRCQLVPFQRLSRRALLTFVSERRPELSPEALAAVVRVAAGRLDRAARLLDEEAIAQRDALLDLARTPYAAERFDAGEAARVVLGFARTAADRAREAAAAQEVEETARERDQRARRAARGAEREEIVEALDLLASWYRDMVAAAAGAGSAAFNADRLDLLDRDGRQVGLAAATAAVEAVAETRRRFELQVFAALALEALFVELGQALRPHRAPVPAEVDTALTQ
jgi:DNA polymerase-3 subunit delta'